MTEDMMLNHLPSLEEIEIMLAIKNMEEYVAHTWKVLEPGVEYKSNWHIGAICEHLEAVLNNEIRHLLINMPPRHMKSLGVSVFLPSYAWLNNPYLQFLYSSYSQGLSVRDSVKTRRLIDSAVYQKLLLEAQSDVLKYEHGPFKLAYDQNAKTKFENNYSGHRIATSVGGTVTGDGGDIVVVDDAHNIKEAESAQVRKGVLSWWKESMQSRLNDPKKGHFIACMQRAHEEDLSGYIIEQDEVDGEWTKLILPARFENAHRSKLTVNGFKDPRTEIDEPLWKDHYGDKELKKLERALGTYAAAGQLQQRPAPRSGGMFDKANWVIVEAINRQHIVESTRYWDKAGTDAAGCYTAGLLMHRMVDDSYLIEDVERGQWSYGKREQQIKNTAIKDSPAINIWIEQEGGSGGKESADLTIKNLSGFNCQKENSTGDKVTRANPLSAQVEISNVKLLKGAWNKDFIDEAAMFPNGKYKDQIDAGSGAFNKLALGGDDVGTW